jgi:hypothetical protein
MSKNTTNNSAQVETNFRSVMPHAEEKEQKITKFA